MEVAEALSLFFFFSSVGVDEGKLEKKCFVIEKESNK